MRPATDFASINLQLGAATGMSLIEAVRAADPDDRELRNRSVRSHERTPSG